MTADHRYMACSRRGGIFIVGEAVRIPASYITGAAASSRGKSVRRAERRADDGEAARSSLRQRASIRYRELGVPTASEKIRLLGESSQER